MHLNFLLIEAQNCLRPVLRQGFLVPQQEIYEQGSKVSYSCNPGLKPAGGELKCENGQWSHVPHCIGK